MVEVTRRELEEIVQSLDTAVQANQIGGKTAIDT